ncbi:MAG: hypothetical protein E7224_00620 [Clostridiales bacterium]|nr:hypothetical protein [Clostridiales bacterium]
MKRRTLAWVLVVAMLIALFPAAVFADSETATQNLIMPEKVTYKAGETFEVALRMEASAGLSGYDGNITYDSTRLELVGDPVYTAPNAAMEMMMATDHSTAGFISVGSMAMADTTEAVSVDIIKATFRVKDDASIGAAVIKIDTESNSYAMSFSGEGVAVTGELQSTRVAVIEEISGTIDVTGIDAPVKNAAPDTAVAETNQYTGTISWSPAVGDKFAQNTVYTATVTLTAKAGYIFANGTTVAVLGDVAANKVQVAANGSTLTFNVTFPKTADKDAQKIVVFDDTREFTFGDTGLNVGASLEIGNGTLEYASSDNSVVGVDGLGGILIRKAGTATIVVSASETDEYAKSFKTVQVTVKPYTITEENIFFEVEDKDYDGHTGIAANGYLKAVGMQGDTFYPFGEGEEIFFFYDPDLFPSKNVGTYDLDAIFTLTERGQEWYTFETGNTATVTTIAKINPCEDVTDITDKNQKVAVGIGTFKDVAIKGVGDELATGAVTYSYDGKTSKILIQAALKKLNEGDTAQISYNFTGTENYLGAEVSGIINVEMVDVAFSFAGAAVAPGNGIKLESEPTYGMKWSDIIGNDKNIVAKVGDFTCTDAQYTWEVDGAAMNASAYPSAGKHDVALLFNGTINGQKYTDIEVFAINNLMVVPWELKASDLDYRGVSVEKEYDGNTAYGETVYVPVYSSSMKNNDASFKVPGTVTFSSKNAGVQTVKFTADDENPANTNYVLADDITLNLSGRITQKALTVTVNDLTYAKTYDGSKAEGNAVTTGNLGTNALPGDEVFAVYSFVAFDGTDVGTTSATIRLNSLTGADAGNYRLTNAGTLTVLASIAKADWTGATTASVNVPVDGTAGKTITLTLPAGAALAGDVTIADNSFVTSAALADGKLVIKATAKAEDTATTVTLPIKSTNYNNYNLVVTVTAKDIDFFMDAAFTDAVTAEKALTIKAAPVYGDRWSQIVSMKTSRFYAEGPDGAVAGTYKLSVDANAYPTKGAHDWQLLFTATDGSYTDEVVLEGTATVAPKTLTAANLYYSGTITKEYDGTTDLGDVTVTVRSGLVAGDRTKTLEGTGVFNSADVATANKVIFTPNALAADDNYVLEAGLTYDISARITQKALTVTAGDLKYAKTYDGSTAIGDAALTGALATDALAGDDVTATYTFTAFAGTDVGTDAAAIRLNGLTGADAGNYKLANVGNLTVAASIAKADWTGAKELSVNVPVDGTVSEGKTVTLTLPAGAVLVGDVTIADNSFVTSAALADGKLVIKANAKAEDTATTVTLPIKSTNYNNYNLVVTVTAKNISYEVYIPGQGYVPATLELMLKIKENPVYGDSWNEILADNYDIYAFDPDGNPINGGMWFVIDGSDDYDKYPAKGEHSWKLMFGSDLYPEQVVYSGTVTVAPKTLTAADLQYTGEAITKVYDGTKDLGAVSMDVKASALAGEDTELTLTGNAVFDSANTDATKVIFTPDALAADSNYALADGLTADIRATITKKETAISAVTVTDKTYDGTASAAITAITIPGVSGDLVKDTDFEATAVFPDKNADDANVDVTVNVTLKGDAAKNYTLTNGKDYKLTEAAKINKATLTWKLAAVPGASYDYNGAADYNVYAVIGGAAAGEAPVIDVTYGGEADKPVDAGTYALAAALNEAWTENYALAAEAEDGSLTSFTINKVRMPLYSLSKTVGKDAMLDVDPAEFGMTEEVTDITYTAPDGITVEVVDGALRIITPADAAVGTKTISDIQFTIANANYTVDKVSLVLDITDAEIVSIGVGDTELGLEDLDGTTVEDLLMEDVEDAENYTVESYTNLATGTTSSTAPTVPGKYAVTIKYNKPATAETAAQAGSGTILLAIAKATPEVGVTYDEITAAGKTLADANLALDMGVTNMQGTVKWVAADGMTPLPLSTVVKANTSYKWLFTPDDADKYENLAGSVVLYTVSMGGGGGAAPAPKPPVKPEEPEVTPVDQIFTDVAATDWFASAVQYVYDKGMMNGTAADKFSPNATTTRGMIVTILWRLEGSPAVSDSSFSDVAAGEWYSDAVAWAAENKIVTGYTSGEFGAKDDITREQLATILFRYAQYKGLESLTLEENLIGYPDEAAISSYAIPALNWAVGQSLINGMGDGSLAPQGEATRAQVAAILMRYCEANDAE